MTPSGNTGATGPAWIDERIRDREAAWPLWVLSAGLLLVVAVGLTAGAWIWTSEGWLVYALP